LVIKLAKNPIETFITVWLFIFFFESAFVEGFQAVQTNKTFRVKFSKHSSNTSTRDGFVAS